MAQSKASINSIYAEIITLRREIELIRTALIPEEKVSEKEMKKHIACSGFNIHDIAVRAC